jgi:DNA-binding IclR family transcriptional regulator
MGAIASAVVRQGDRTLVLRRWRSRMAGQVGAERGDRALSLFGAIALAVGDALEGNEADALTEEERLELRSLDELDRFFTYLNARLLAPK